MTAALALREPVSGRLIGVFTADFFLDDISRFLESTARATAIGSVRLLVLSREGIVVAESSGQPDEQAATLARQGGRALPRGFAALEPERPVTVSFPAGRGAVHRGVPGDRLGRRPGVDRGGDAARGRGAAGGVQHASGCADAGAAAADGGGGVGLGGGAPGVWAAERGGARPGAGRAVRDLAGAVAVVVRAGDRGGGGLGRSDEVWAALVRAVRADGAGGRLAGAGRGCAPGRAIPADDDLLLGRGGVQSDRGASVAGAVDRAVERVLAGDDGDLERGARDDRQVPGGWDPGVLQCAARRAGSCPAGVHGGGRAARLGWRS